MDRHSLTEMIGKLMINTIINGHAGFQSEGGEEGGVAGVPGKPAYTCRSTKPGVLFHSVGFSHPDKNCQ